MVTTRRKVPRPAQPAEAIFAFRDRDRALSLDDAEWLVAQLRALKPTWQAAELLAERIEKSRKTGAPIETTLEEKRALIDGLYAVCAADGLISTIEDNDVRRVASEADDIIKALSQRAPPALLG